MVIATAGETVEDIGTAVAWLGDEDVVIHDACYVFRSEMDPKFVSYFLRTSDFKNQARSKVSSSKISSISVKNLGRILIPVPPLEVQREIVRILDTFTALEAELEAELEARRIQYEHYRDTLVSGNTEWKRATLGDVGTFVRGSGLQKKDLLDAGVPAIHYGQVHTEYGVWTDKTVSFIAPDFAARLRKAKPGDVVLATTSEDDEAVGKATAWVGHEDAAVSSDALIYQHSLEPKYVAYFLASRSFQDQKRQYITGTKVRRLSARNLEKIIIPVPPIETQKEIVETLDQFDTLTNDLNIGLPAEIEARRKQYEYYRDQLLTFEELV